MVAVSADEFAALLKVTSDPRYRAALYLGRDAGLRIGEIRGLQWDDINELRCSLTVARSIDPRGNVTPPKNRKRRSVPMSEPLRQALKQAPANGKTIIGRLQDGLPMSYWGLRDGLNAIYKAANVPRPPHPWHSLRHAFCTELAKAGTPIHVIKELAGHASISTTLRYMHTNEEAKRNAISAFGESRLGYRRDTTEAKNKKSAVTNGDCSAFSSDPNG